MSIHAVSWALSVDAGGPSAKCTLLVIASYADEHGHCWPAQSTVAKESDQSVDTVQRRIRDLEGIGLITREERPEQNGKAGGRYYYQLAMTKKIQEEETTPHPAARSETTPQNEPTTPQTPPKPHRTVAVQTAILNPSLKPLVARPKNDKSKAHRLPEDWTPSLKQVSDAKALGLTDADIRRAVPEFRDYWTDRGGKDACKLSWDGTWRNNCRRTAERLGRKPKETTGSNYKFTRADWERAISMFKETSNWPGPGPAPGEIGCLAPDDLCERNLL